MNSKVASKWTLPDYDVDPRLIKSIAFTGGDPIYKFLAVTDIAKREVSYNGDVLTGSTDQTVQVILTLSAQDGSVMTHPQSIKIEPINPQF